MKAEKKVICEETCGEVYKGRKELKLVKITKDLIW
jgi:hypothetical protein